MSIDLGRAPTPEEIEEARQRAMSAQTSCSCGAAATRKAAIATAIATTTTITRTGAAAAATTKKAIFQPFVKRLHSQVKPFFIDGMRQRRPSRTCTYPVRHTPWPENRQGLHKPLRQPEKLSASEPISKIAAHDRIFSQMPQKPAAFHKGFFKRGPHLHAACIFPTPLSSSGRARRLNGRWAHVSLILRNHDFFQPPSFRFPAVYQNGFPVVPGSDGRSNGPHFPHHLQGTGG